MAEKRAQLVTLGTLEQGLLRMKREYLAAIAGAGYASFRKAEAVPNSDEAKADVLYLVQDKASGLYGIWALIDGAMVQVGSTAVDLDGYVTREELDETVQAAVKQVPTEGLVATDDEVDEVMAEIFGGTGEDGTVATDEEVAEVFREIFGH
jgi:hypothetical protein